MKRINLISTDHKKYVLIFDDDDKPIIDKLSILATYNKAGALPIANRYSLARHVLINEDTTFYVKYINGNKFDVRKHNLYMLPVPDKKNNKYFKPVDYDELKIHEYNIFQLVTGKYDNEHIVVVTARKKYQIEYNRNNKTFVKSKEYINFQKTRAEYGILEEIKDIQKEKKYKSQNKIYRLVSSSIESASDLWNPYLIKIGSKFYSLSYNWVEDVFARNTAFKMIIQYCPAIIETIRLIANEWQGVPGDPRLIVKTKKTQGRSMKSQRPAKLKDWSL